MKPLKNKSILITGGTGSFGRYFAQYLLEHCQPERVVIFSRDELKQFQLHKELPDPRMRFFLGDVRDLERLQHAFRKVDVVVHAAALKQVPALEFNPFEAIKTNVLGSQNVITAALEQGVKQVVLVSSDKAAQPVNLYGASKLCAERLFIAANAFGGEHTRFATVRYGNVIGSRGSVVETILSQPTPKKVQLTDPEMTRFWITLKQASQLVQFALAQMVGGEIFVPKIPSMKLADLFTALAPQAVQKVVGLRPGEKIHEVLLTEQEARHAVELEKYFVILPEFLHQQKRAQPLRKYQRLGKKLGPNFRYTSERNPQWLFKKSLQALMKEPRTLV